MNMKYIGNELELFKNAHNWKSYFSGKLRDDIYGDVLEVGSGICANTKYLNNSNVTSWTCLEPDENLINSIEENNTNNIFVNGTIDSIKDDKKFDTIVYIDVLEHIEEDTKRG